MEIKKILEGKKYGFSVDLVGILRYFGAEKRVKRKNGEDVEKRDLVVEDETGEIYVTVWGKMEVEVPVGTVVGIRQAKVSEYNGVSLNLTLREDSIVISPIHYLTSTLKNLSQNLSKPQKPHIPPPSLRFATLKHPLHHQTLP